MNIWFAHAGEVHETVVESTTHAFEVDPFIAVVIALLSAALVVTLAQLIFKKPSLTIILSLASLFLIGVLSYSAAPIISAVCIVIGFGVSLAVVFGGLLHGK